jgi:multiple antibiotic resistance protein
MVFIATADSGERDISMLVDVMVNSLYVLALLNPISKISVLSSLSTTDTKDHVSLVAAKSSAIAAVIIILNMVFGEFILRHVFHLQLYSLRIAGGLVLCWVGFNALRKGVFFERDLPARFADIAVVPLACPMIAGPAALTASLTMIVQQGTLVAVFSVLLALLINFIIMISAKNISRLLTRLNILGAIIRITGLIVMTMGVQMTLDGLSAWQ